MVESRLPTGVLTLLFSDIEGSTALLWRLGDRFADVLSAHHAILRGAFKRWHGYELRTEGDSFFVVFSSVADAVNAALQAQRELGSYAWPDGGRIRVRMGLHTGNPTPLENDYTGRDVHLAARVASAAHGGQVVLTEATGRITAEQGPAGVSLMDLGWHRLKDIPDPVHLYQLAADGLQQQFPPLNSIGGLSQLPGHAASIVGRDKELRDLQELITGQAQLVTLTGPGGCGKTRLAVATAVAVDRAFSDGVYFVPLESVTSADVMWTTIAEVLGVPVEVRDPPRVVEYLSRRRALLLLDNLEQLPTAPSVVQELLRAIGIRVIATSRRPLHIPGEFEYPVPPLSLASDGALSQVRDSPAVQLFVQRGQMVRPGFALDEDNLVHVVSICRLLDGLPLAIELAAARLKVFSPRALEARLSKNLELAASQVSRPARHQTLRNTVTWSYEMLPEELQWLFRQLGVFAGDFDLDAVAFVAADGIDPLDGITELVDVSLVNVQEGPDGEPRARLLQTISVYARQWLADAGELEPARRRHAVYYLSVVEAVAPRLRSSQYLNARDRIEAELDNVREALAWALPEAPADGEPAPDRLVLGLRFCQALNWFWYACGYHAEGRDWLARAVKSAAGQETPELMSSLHGLAVLLLEHGEVEQGRDALRTCLEFWRRNGDTSKIAQELSSLAVAHRALGELDIARALLQESVAVARAAGDKGRLASALSNLALIDLDEQAPGSAIQRLQEALAIDRELGDTWGEATDHINIAGAMLQDGRIEEAYELLRAVAASTVALGDVDLTINLVEVFAMVFADLDDPQRAARMLGAAQAMRERAELPIAAADAALLERSIRKVRPTPPDDGWTRNTQLGAGYSIDDVLEDALREAQ